MAKSSSLDRASCVLTSGRWGHVCDGVPGERWGHLPGWRITWAIIEIRGKDSSCLFERKLPWIFGSTGAKHLKPDHSYFLCGKGVFLPVDKASLYVEEVSAPLGPGTQSDRKICPPGISLREIKHGNDWLNLLQARRVGGCLWLWPDNHVGSSGNC